ncbi:hypothetical protein HYU18_02660, partial [Candidatus Woesearchaeota archaeon]|nr:hypothetical protein [Candidatus Woesearchaeota archaeon]
MSKMTMDRLVQLRNVMKRRKPNFKIQNSNDPRKRFAGRWKRPKGLQSKMRERRKGNPRYIEPGYGSPAQVRGTTTEGLFPVVVRTVKDLSGIKAGFGAVVAATVGMKRKLEIVKAAADRKIRLLNLNAEEFGKSAAESMAARKQRRQQLKSKAAAQAVKKEPAAT